jgi:alpha-amylase/alpha-mannosidase (GH57 family)
MPVLRVVVLWHQHQPFYKDLVTDEYRLPWVRLHALKDYYGMVKLLDEFPNVHQTFNLVPSLISQIQDYVAGVARDPFLEVAAKPVRDLTPDERQFGLKYLFQANSVNLIGRYPRYCELWDLFRSAGESPERADKYFQPQDFTDLQVLSQLAWFDEFFLEEPEVAALVKKGRGFSLNDQNFVMSHQRKLIARVLPAHADAAKRGGVEISTSPFYHPILPLVCDTNMGATSTPGLPLPQNRFVHPEDAREQLQRGLDLHQQVFGVRARGVWPAEGSVSEEVFALAHKLGVNWMATDEGVLGRSLGVSFERDGYGRVSPEAGEKLYTMHRYEHGETEMHLVFRDHAISDLIGFVYSGMAAQDAANHLMHRIQEAARPLLSRGHDTLIPIILDGENAWEYYPKSGREFLRRFYDRLQREPGIEAVTISEAIQRHQNKSTLSSLVPGSWINANFNVWIGAPEDNRAWDFLYHARNFYSEVSPHCSEAQRKLALEELLIAEGSDWNWWYGPEHSSANDREFDELYRKHLSNVYQALGATPPDYLAQPITSEMVRPSFTPQTHYIHPEVTGDTVRYFEWMGAAHYVADRRAGAMHGKVFLCDALFAGIDEMNVYGRLDFVDNGPENDFEVVVNVESWADQSSRPRRAMRLNVKIANQTIQSRKLSEPDSGETANIAELPEGVAAALGRSFEFKFPLTLLLATPVASSAGNDHARSSLATTKLRVRVSVWKNRLPVDALPVEGWIDLQLLSEEDLMSVSH